MTRDEIAKKVAEELGYTVTTYGTWHIHGVALVARTRDALIDARVRVEELTTALQQMRALLSEPDAVKWEARNR